MTSLIAWVGVDQRGPTSVYLASDSRLSWSQTENWDTGRKLFFSRNYADILGYCGDVVFPSQKLGQIIEKIDSNVFFTADITASEKQELIFQSLKDSFAEYPTRHQNPFQVIYFTRAGYNMSAVFSLSRFSWDKDNDWVKTDLKIPESSQLIDVLGSGSTSVKSWYDRWKKSDSGGTSRSVFSAFCDSLSSGEDPRSGGAPQLVGIHRSGSSKSFGIIYRNKRFLSGDEVSNSTTLNNIEWINELFEICDGISKKPKKRSQLQPRPTQLIIKKEDI
jgi:hypothetical protein